MEKKRNSCPVNQGYEGILVNSLSFFLDSFETCIFDIFYADILRLEWHIKEYFYKHIFNNKGDIQSDNWLNNLDGNFSFFFILIVKPSLKYTSIYDKSMSTKGKLIFPINE